MRTHEVDEAAGGQVHAEQAEEPFSAHEPRKIFAAHEAVVGGHGGREGVGLMLETGDEDVHHHWAVS
jgi:hypothetical protein